MAPRKKGQSIGGRYVYQGVDPLTGRRLNVRAATLSELESRVERVGRIRDGLRYGDISVSEARGMLRPAIGMATRVPELWRRYVKGLAMSSEVAAESVWRHQLAPWFGECAVWDLSETKMREWKTDLERARRPKGARGYAPKTIRRAFDFLRACVMLAERDGAISGIPWGQFSVPSPRQPLREREALRDPGELIMLLEAAAEWDKEHPAGRLPALLVLCLTGLRQGEACGLGWDDLELEREPQMLHIRHQARQGWRRFEGGARPLAVPKNKSARVQQLHPDVARALLHHRRELARRGHYREDGPVFPRPGTSEWRTGGELLSPDAFREVVRRAKLPNVSAWTVHSTRHSFARLELVGHGGDLRSVGERTGHRDLSQLEGYLRKGARGGGGSKIPNLPHFLGPPALEAHAVEVHEFAGARVVGALMPPAPDEPPSPHPREPDNWPTLAVAWVRDGEKGKRPRVVTDALKGHYSRGHARELHRSGNAEKARAAGARARRAALGAWARAVAVARRTPF